MSLLVPSFLQGAEAPTVHRAEQVKKTAIGVGYGALATIGSGLVLLGLSDTLGRYTEGIKPHRFKFGRFFHKKDTENEEYQSSALKSATITALGAGMIWYGTRGLKKTIYGQTQEEKQAEKEQTEKIKDTIQETITQAGKTVFDISKKAVRVTAYSMSAGIGAVTLLVGIWHWARAIIPHRKAPFKQLKKEWEKDGGKFVGYCISFPLGASLLMFGIHGLSKEYQSFKNNDEHQNKKAVEEQVDDDMKPIDKRSPVRLVPQMVDVAVQTDISHLMEKE